MRLFIFCADPREEADLSKKIEQWLLAQGEKAIFLSLLGGPICLAYPGHLCSTADTVVEQINRAKLLFPDLTDVILIGHSCGFYAFIPKVVDLQTMRGDMIKGVRFLSCRISGLNFSAYFDGDNDVGTPFEEITGVETLV